MNIDTIVGIDYSMTCPCVCVHDLSSHFVFSNCKFLFQLDYKIEFSSGIIKQVVIPKPKLFQTSEERWDLISENVVNFIKPHNVVSFGVEGYSYGSFSNNNSQMGEHTGLLKHKIWKLGIPISTVNITHVKSFSGAQGGGGAKKGQMLDKFKEDSPSGFQHLLETVGVEVQKKKTKSGKITDYVCSPAADIIDAYYLTQYLWGRYMGYIPEPVPKTKKKPKKSS